MQSAKFHRLRSRTRQSALAALIACAVAATAGTPASAAGFFETLFGIRPAQPAYAPRPQQTIPLASPANPAAALAKKKAKAKVARAAAPQPRRAAVRPPVLAGPLGPFLLDPTLRRGDVVVTSEGLKVFTGNGGGQHSAGDFTALSRASQFAAGKSPVLAAIDKANRAAAKPLVEVQAVPVVRPAPQPAAAASSSPGKQASASGPVR